LPAILFRTPNQVNAQELLREVHAAEEVMEAGGVVQGGAHSPREFVVVPMPERAALLAGLPLTV